ncbi:MAG: pyruvate dehydrogenase complex dihydrolipoamide acetyltransferase [Beijerinckiaceae bacterium]|jgi:pyruvate dehydrogenase E2 component (dihydrolipoamide acetyltransferase)
MSEPITMPTLSDTMNSGRLVKWVMKLGDPIKKGDTIAEIETDKAVMEVTAFHDGYLAGPLALEGTEMPVGQIIGYIADSPGGADAEAAQAPPVVPDVAPPEIAHAADVPAEVRVEPKAAASEAGKSVPAPVAKPAVAPVQTTSAQISSSPSSPQPAEEAGTKPAPTPQFTSLQREDAIHSLPLPAESSSLLSPAEKSAPMVSADEARASNTNRVISSPLARRLAEEYGVDLAHIQGSGPHGRIVAADVEAAKSGKGALAPAATGAAEPAAMGTATPTVAGVAASAVHGMSDPQIRALYPEGSYEFVPHDGMRRIIAQRLVQSNLTIPHFYLTVDCDIGGLLDAREEINNAAPQDKDGKPLWKLSVNDFVIKALALALQRVPDANATWTESGMLKHQHSDIGVAVAIKGGLIAPLLRNAEAKSLSVISNEMKELAARARARRLKPEEYLGGASAVSNLGMHGIKDFTAVINPPQATILAIGAGEERAVVRSGKIEIATIMTVTLSCDHRVVDGALGAELLGAFKALIEHPVMMAA